MTTPCLTFAATSAPVRFGAVVAAPAAVLHAIWSEITAGISDRFVGFAGRQRRIAAAAFRAALSSSVNIADGAQRHRLSMVSPGPPASETGTPAAKNANTGTATPAERTEPVLDVLGQPWPRATGAPNRLHEPEQDAGGLRPV